MENEGKREPGEKRYLQSASVSRAAFCGQHVCECVYVKMCVCVCVCVCTMVTEDWCRGGISF